MTEFIDTHEGVVLVIEGGHPRAATRPEQELRVEVDRLREGLDALGAEHAAVCDERDRLRDALEKYGEHTTFCASYMELDASCTCGFDAALGSR